LTYNHSVYYITNYLPFKIVYGFNHLTPLDLIYMLMKGLVLMVIKKHRW